MLPHASEGKGGRRTTDLAERVVLSKSDFTALVDRMEADGYVARRPDPDDRRSTRIVLTAFGRKRHAEASRHHKGVVRRIFTSMVDDDEAAVIVEVLERVREALGRWEFADWSRGRNARPSGETAKDRPGGREVSAGAMRALSRVPVRSSLFDDPDRTGGHGQRDRVAADSRPVDRHELRTMRPWLVAGSRGRSNQRRLRRG